MSKTISIVIPDLLEADLQKAADDLGIPRSRYITNLLLNWKEKRYTLKLHNPSCEHLTNEVYCSFFKTQCTYLLSKQDSCSGYYPKETY